MKFLTPVILSFFFMACQNQEVKIPVNDNHGLHEVWDNSRIYVLFQTENNDTLADLKLGQTISTTHWLVAVDKRLKLKHLTKALAKILKKRHKKSIHSKEGMHAYFTFLDSVQKKVSFIDFDSLQLMPEYFTSSSYFQEYPKADSGFQKYHLNIGRRHILLNDSIDVSGLSKTRIGDSLTRMIHTNKTPVKLYLNFEPEVYFDRFLDYYTFFKNNPALNKKLSPKIFIFTP